jgi:hypothetical protein
MRGIANDVCHPDARRRGGTSHPKLQTSCHPKRDLTVDGRSLAVCAARDDTRFLSNHFPA